jgi:membrane dipeptidase
MIDLDRRHLMTLATAAVATPLSAGAQPKAKAQPQPRRGGLKDTIIINTLGSVGDPNPVNGQANEDRFNARAIRDAHASGMTAWNQTIGGSGTGLKNPFEDYVADIARWDARIRAYPNDFLKVYSTADILRAKREKKIGVIYGFQNLGQIGDDPARIDIFANLGVKVMQLTYNLKNQLGCGSTVAENCGVLSLGEQAIERMNANKVIVDLAHSGQKMVFDAARISKQPIAITHTGCRAVSDLPRNKTDAELKLVADKGGYVGIYFMLYLNPQGRAFAADLVRHIEHAVNVCGEDHVGIGTDGGITSYDDMDAYMANFHKEYETRAKAGIAAPGEGPQNFPFLRDLRGPNQFFDLADRLSKRPGFTPRRIEKILGLNFLNYAKSIWGA